MPFRFVHTADVHLDSPLRSLALRDPELAELVGDATRLSFERAVRLCLDERVDALMIAGDLYDGEQTSMKTALFLAAQMRRLDEAGIRAFVVRGNHDAASRITRELSLPPGVKIFGGRGEAVSLERPGGALPVAVHGVSFANPSAPESLLPKFRAPVAGAFNVALLHTSLAGAPGHDVYAPCGVADLAGAGFDYWCLGHVHKREVHRRDPFVVMPGMPQGRDVGEDGPKSVTLAHVEDGGGVAIRQHPTSVAQFERVDVDLAGVEEWRGVAARVGEALEGARSAVEADCLVARLRLRGRTPMAWRLLRDRDRVRGEAGERAAAAGRTWVEKIEMAVAPEAGDGPVAGAVGELAATMRDEIPRSEEFRRAAAGLAEDLARDLPHEARRALGDGEAEREAILDELIAEGREEVLAHLNEAREAG